MNKDPIEQIVSYIRTRVKRSPDLGIICGSGLGHLVDVLSNVVSIDYKDLQQFGFPQSTVSGHAGQFAFGELGGKYVIAMKGRFHFYEGYQTPVVSQHDVTDVIGRLDCLSEFWLHWAVGF